jgi:hypothetical protein
MGGVLEKIRYDRIPPSKKRPADLRRAILRQRAAHDCLPLEFLELETAKEILGEVFNTSASDVDEMIQQRMTEMDAVMSVRYGREMQLEICPSAYSRFKKYTQSAP